MNIITKPLSPGLLGDFLEFFDNDAFSDNPDWAGCYCCFYHCTDSMGWEKRTGAENRAAAQSMIKSGAMQGYLAYIGGRPAGWVNAGARENFARLSENPKLPEGANVCSIVCFTISPSFRRVGIAKALLSAVLEGAKGKFHFVEAYPLKGEQTQAMHYHGPLSMYEDAGFEIVKEFEKYFVVRKAL